jgi:uncharacterized protein YjbI with pentapeptide repeats
MNRKLMIVVLLSVFGCSGGGQVGTGGDYQQVEMQGRVVAGDQPVQGASVAVYVGDSEALATTDSQGRYVATLSIPDDALDQLVRIEATVDEAQAAAVSSAAKFKWVSLPGSINALQGAAGGEDAVSDEHVPRLVVNTYSTGEYAALKHANNGDDITSQQQLDDLLEALDDADVMRLAALFDLALTDTTYTLPAAISDTLALLESSAAVDVELGRFTQDDPTAVANRANAIALREFSAADCASRVPNAVLRGCDLTGIAHEAADLSNADFSFTLLMDTQFTHVDMRNSVFALANGDQAYFEAVDISGADFSGTALSNTKFIDLSSNNILFNGGVVTSAEFYKTSFVGAHFVGANLANALIHQSTFTNTDFRHANLSYVTFDHVALDGSDFSGANLSGAVFSNVTTVGVIWNGAICPDGSVSSGTCDINPASRPNCDQPGPGANLRGCVFDYQNLAGVDLSGADLSNASLRGAALQQTNFSGANLTNAQLQSAAMQQANLTNAVLSLANLQYAALSQVVVTGATWSGATCPDGEIAGSGGCSSAADVD